MNKMTIAVAFLAGLSGGLAGRYVSPPAAFAQVQAPAAKEIRAQSFTLVDSSNQAIGTFTAESEGQPAKGTIVSPQGQPTPAPGLSRIVLRDIIGREIWSAGGSGFRLLRDR